ncbi:MAG: DnaD domain protein [Oscillospiraceae bacterium]|nr:DnaD domain protein [Oscillospiraceae bacterium]
MDLVSLPMNDLRKLIGAAAPDAALLYLFLKAGGTVDAAGDTLHMNQSRAQTAASALRQMGLLEAPEHAVLRPAEPPQYSENDLRSRLSGGDFPLLLGEVQRRLGRVLSTEEMRILLSMYDYLGLPVEVISTLVTYCIERSRARGVTRSPSIRTIEKEAYHWADNGIDTLEGATAYMQADLERQGRMGAIRRTLGIDGRALTATEARYLGSWLDMGFGEKEIALAYEKTVMNTGALKWPYLNSILKSWCSKNLLTVAQIESGDGRAARPNQVGAVGSFEREALSRMLQLDKEG